MKENNIKEDRLKNTNKVIPIIGICSLIIILLIIIFINLKKINNNSKNKINNNNYTDTENESYDKKTYKVGELYFANFNNYINRPETTTTIKYNDAANIDGEITIEEDNVYLKYEKNNIKESKKININDEKPKYIMVISANMIRYIYILTEDGNVYLNQAQSTNNSIDEFLNFIRIKNLSNVSEMYKYGQTPYFMINKQLHTVYGELAHHETLIKEDPIDIQTSTGNYYFMQIGNDGLLYKNIIKKTYMIGSPESTDSILIHEKKENELFKTFNNENIIVSVLLNIDNDTFLIDTTGNYYKVELINNKEINLNIINSKKVTSVNKYSKDSIVQKIEINYSDNSKDTYTKNINKNIW